MTKRYRLTVTAGVQTGQVWEDCPSRFSVGSAPTCELILIDCPPDSVFCVELEKNAVNFSGHGVDDRGISYGKSFELTNNCAIKLEAIEPIIITQISDSMKSLRNASTSKVFNWVMAGAIGSFVLTAAIASDYLMSPSAVNTNKSNQGIADKADLKKQKLIANFDKSVVAPKTFSNGELERRFGCNKDCFDKNQIAALIPGVHGSIQMKDGRKMNVGSIVAEGLAVSLIGDNYVLFGNGDDSILVELM
jgi:hypothetical protein